MAKFKKMWQDNSLTINTKKLIVTTLVFPIMLYAVETWTLKQNIRKKIDAFELWCWRRMLRIPWTAHRTIISVLREVYAGQRLSSIVLGRIVKYFGHLTRSNTGLEMIVIQGRVEGSRGRGRSPARWTDQIRATSNARHRSRWRKLARRIQALEAWSY